MNKFKEWLKKLKNPSPLAIGLYIAFSIIVIAGTITLLFFDVHPIISYISYGISAITTTYFVYICIILTPKIKSTIINQLKKHKFTNDMLMSYGYRSVIFAIFSFIINTLYAIFQGVFAILSGSFWYISLALYYLLLSLTRAGLIIATSKNRNLPPNEKEFRATKTYRNCGIWMVILNFALIGAMVLMVIDGRGFKYAGLMIYAIAAYTFYKLGMSIYNIVKCKKENLPITQAMKNISFADSLVSILALQTALLFEFGNGFDYRLPNALTSGAVSLTIIALGIIMIINGTKNLKKAKGKTK